MQVNRFPSGDAAARRSFLRRREFLGLVGALAAWPPVGRAQQSRPIIGFLHCGSKTFAGPQVSAFWQALNQAGLVENRDVVVIYRWGERHRERLPALALDLCRQGASLIVASGASSVVAARQATETIPIIFVAASDSPGSGFDLEHPNANITGISLASPDLLAERLQTLLKLAPALRSVGVLLNPQTPNIEVQLQYVSDTAKRQGFHAQVINGSDDNAFAAALDEIAQRRQEALVVANDGFLNGERERLIAVTNTSMIPAAFANREFVEAGGLLSYGPSVIEAYRQAGAYAVRILKGEKPMDLPIENPFEMELALNATVAASLGLQIPPDLLATASEVIR